MRTIRTTGGYTTPLIVTVLDTLKSDMGLFTYKAGLIPSNVGVDDPAFPAKTDGVWQPATGTYPEPGTAKITVPVTSPPGNYWVWILVIQPGGATTPVRASDDRITTY